MIIFHNFHLIFLVKGLMNLVEYLNNLRRLVLVMVDMHLQKSPQQERNSL